MKIRKSLLFSLLALLIIGGIAGGIFWSTKKSSYGVTTKEGFVSDLMNNLSDATNRQSLIDAYCVATSESQGFGDSDAPGLFYDPSQSLFLGLLCTHSDQRDKVRNLVKSYDREDMRTPGCERNSDMNSCDLSVFLPKIFAVVMNDLSKAKLAQLYSYQGSSTDEAIKSFSDTYFGPGASICGSQSSTYIGKSQGSEKEAPCMHPQTYTILQQYIQQAGKLAQQTTYIDAQRLLTPQSGNCQKNSQDFLLCAFDSTNPYAWDAFHNTLYNELLFYKLLIVLAGDRLQYPEYNEFRYFNDGNTEAEQATIRLNQEAQISEEAVMYTEKTLQNMQSSFPIHIGLLAYYEDIIAFRKSLLRIYTPIHQLYYKLRNVQEKQ